MAVVLALAGTFVYLRVDSDLSSSIDDGLATRVDDLARQLQGSEPEDVGLGDQRSEEAPDILTQVLRPDGRIVASSTGRPFEPILSPGQLAEARTEPTYFDAVGVPGIEEGARLLAKSVSSGDGELVVLAGASTGDRSETLASLATTFVIGGPIALVVASALGYFLAAFAMRPVETMRRRAGEITLSRDGERLPLPAADDEIRRLGLTLNEMLDRIEDSLARERAFVAGAGHELRTPLAVLRGELELALRPERSRHEAEAAMRSAIEEADRLSGLATDLLALAGSESGRIPVELAPTEIDPLLERTRHRYARAAADAGRSLSVGGDRGLRWNLDAGRIEAALGNLVENALRHGDGGIELCGRGTGRGLELTVGDAGPGFPEEFAGRAFDRFSRAETSRTTAGTGLGLAIVRAIAEAHDGCAEIAPGPGATVRIVIPGPA